MHSKDSEPLGFFGLTGHIDLMNSMYLHSYFSARGLTTLGNLVSYEFDWTGPR